MHATREDQDVTVLSWVYYDLFTGDIKINRKDNLFFVRKMHIQ